MKSHSPGSVPEGGSRSHTHTHSYPECGGIVPGHVQTGLGQALERGKKWAAPLSPAPRGRGSSQRGRGHGNVGGGESTFPGLSSDQPRPSPQAQFGGSLLWGEPCMARAQVLESGRPGLQPRISAFLAVCL